MILAIKSKKRFNFGKFRTQQLIVIKIVGKACHQLGCLIDKTGKPFLPTFFVSAQHPQLNIYLGFILTTPPFAMKDVIVRKCHSNCV